MKLKKKLYQLKGLPVWERFICAVIIIIAIVAKTLLALIFNLIYYAWRLASKFNEKKLKPLFVAINEYLYRRACSVFDHNER